MLSIILKWNKIYLFKNNYYIFFIVLAATSFGLSRPSSGQNVFKNLKASVYKVLFVNVMGSHLQLYSSCNK
jgi:hypothetical protein